MTEYITFLRGINVGGVRIKMAALAAALTEIGLRDVRTVLASGNVVFRCEQSDPSSLQGRIEAALRAAFGYEAWVVVVEPAALRAIVEAYPFAEQSPSTQPYVVMSSDSGALLTLAGLQAQLDPDLERVQLGDPVLYWEVQRGATVDSLFGKELSRARHKRATTTRNMRTLRKVLALLDG